MFVVCYHAEFVDNPFENGDNPHFHRFHRVIHDIGLLKIEQFTNHIRQFVSIAHCDFEAFTTLLAQLFVFGNV